MRAANSGQWNGFSEGVRVDKRLRADLRGRGGWLAHEALPLFARRSSGEVKPWADLRQPSRLRNVEAEDLMKAFADAWNDADRDAFLALMHSEVEMYLPRSVLEGGAPYRGLEGAAQAFADGFDMWERFEIELREVSYVGG